MPESNPVEFPVPDPNGANDSEVLNQGFGDLLKDIFGDIDFFFSREY